MQEGGREFSPQPKGRGVKLVQPGETFQVIQRSGTQNFESRRHRTPIGDVRLIGARGIGIRSHPAIGFTIRDRQIITQDAELMENGNPDLFSLNVELKPGFETKEYQMYCEMRISGIDRGFYASMDVSDVGTEASQGDTLFVWRSLDPADTTEYEIMASPTDSAFMSRMSFSFPVRRV